MSRTWWGGHHSPHTLLFKCKWPWRDSHLRPLTPLCKLAPEIWWCSVLGFFSGLKMGATCELVSFSFPTLVCEDPVAGCPWACQRAWRSLGEGPLGSAQVPWLAFSYLGCFPGCGPARAWHAEPERRKCLLGKGLSCPWGWDDLFSLFFQVQPFIYFSQISLPRTL